MTPEQNFLKRTTIRSLRLDTGNGSRYTYIQRTRVGWKAEETGVQPVISFRVLSLRSKTMILRIFQEKIDWEIFILKSVRIMKH